MRLIARLLRWGVAVLVVTALSVISWTMLWPMKPVDAAPEAEAILCLGGGVYPDGGLEYNSWSRARTCAELYLAGKAPLIVMTAGVTAEEVRSGGDSMAQVALDAGVPPEAVRIEGNSFSTLHNALFSAPLLEGADPIILVTDAFHLPRSWASHKWAGYGTMYLFAADRGGEGYDYIWRIRMVGRETLAIWFNLVRANAYSLGGVIGVDEADRIDWLR